MMAFKYGFYVLACLLSGLTITDCTVCQEQRGSCSCMTDKGLIDLSPLDSKSTQPRFSNLPDSKHTTDMYFYNPCSAFSLGTGGCQNVAVCQTFPQPPSLYLNYGIQQDASFETDVSTQQLRIRYKTMGKKWVYVVHRYALVDLVCDSSQEGKVSVVDADSITFVKMKLESKHCCPGGSGGGSGMSVGTILCILLIVLLSVYLIGGILYMHYVKHAEGVQKIPNYSFWVEMPGLVKDGFLMVVRPVRSSLFGYQEI